MNSIFNAVKNELIIDGPIGVDWTGEGISASMVRDAIASSTGRITVRVNSPGGAADEGIAIYNVLKGSKFGCDTICDSLAASAASIIFLAGDNRTMLAGSKLMIHRALTVEIGNSVQMRKTADVLDVYDESLVEIYSEYMNETREDILNMMTEETWISPEEAVRSGLATNYASNKKTTKKAAAAAWFKNPPEDAPVASRRDLVRARLSMAMAKSGVK